MNSEATGRDDRPTGADQPIIQLRRRLSDWRTLGSIALAVVLLLFFFRVVIQVDLGEIWSLAGEADPLLLLFALLAYYATFPLRALRWRYILARAQTRISARDATEIFCVSWFVNCVVPARLGDVYRAYLLRSHNGAAMSGTFGTLFIERIADILGVFIVAMVAGLWSFRGRVSGEVALLLAIGIGLASGLAMLVVAVRFGGPAVSRRLPRRGARLWNRFLLGSSASLSPRAIGVVGSATAAIWLLEGVRLYLVIRALGLAAVDVSFMAAVFAAQIAALFSIIPLTPAGTGFVEAGLVYALALYGVSTGPAAAVALTDRVITLLSVLAFGAILYLVSPIVRRGFTGADHETSRDRAGSRGD